MASSLQDAGSSNLLLNVAADDVAIIGSRGNFEVLQRKVDDYRTQDTPTGKPKNQQLVSRIEGARIATLADLSSGELTDESIDDDAVYFLELWLTSFSSDSQSRAGFHRLLVDDAATDIRELSNYTGTDRDVHLVAIRGRLLRELPIQLDYLAEIHVPPTVRLREASGLIEFSQGLPPVDISEPPAVAIAVHDTGVDPLHPLLSPVLLGTGVAIPNGAQFDWNGHGTKMAGLAVYGDLAPQVLGSALVPGASLIAVNYLEPGERGDVLWAERTRLSIDIAEEIGDQRQIIHNISMGAPNPHEHEPTSWSVAVDRAAWNGGRGRLIVVSAGNVDPSANPDHYPAQVLASQMSQPAQAWNAVTVTGVTNLDVLSPEDSRLGATNAVARGGQVSPFSSVGPSRLPPSKPDVVAEAGNTAPDGTNVNAGLIGLSLLTTATRIIGTDLTRTNATSSAAAVTSNALARIWAAYPDYLPGTVRALLAHASELPAEAVAQLDAGDVRRTLGHGQINWSRATESEYSRPVLVFEGSLRPKRVDLDGETHREVVFIELPFPTDALDELADSVVTLDVTLSFFVEPSESERRSKYAGARLRWDMQGPFESANDFQARVNALARDDTYTTQSHSYDWEVGSDPRSRSTLQKDSVRLAATAFAGSRLIAVYPVLGWWDKRIGFENSQIPFSLIVSLSSSETSVDLYTPLSVALRVPIDVEIDLEDDS
ncbi:MAG: S8 family peptidase [Lacisediminihabitans sp.]